MNIIVPEAARKAFLENFTRVLGNGCDEETAFNAAFSALVEAWPDGEFHETRNSDEGWARVKQTITLFVDGNFP